MFARTLLRIALELVSLVVLLVLLTALVSVPNKSAWSTTIEDGKTVDHLNLDTATFQRTFTEYLTKVAHGDLGVSRIYQKGKPVTQLVLESARYTLGLLFLALAVAMVLGVLKGVMDFRRLGRPGFGLGPFFTAISQGFPDFWMVFLLQWFIIFAVKSWHWKAWPMTWDPKNIAGSMILPTIVMIIIPLGAIARVTANALAEIEGADFIRTARAKGLSEWKVQFGHSLRPVMGRILDAMPGVLTMMLSNMAIVEWLTNYPGLIRALLISMLPRGASPSAMAQAFFSFPVDIPVVVAAGVFLALVFVIVYELLHWVKGRIDPRLKEGTR